MSLTVAFQQFMVSKTASKQLFSAHESAGINDTVAFNHACKQAEGEGLVVIVRGPDRASEEWWVTKVSKHVLPLSASLEATDASSKEVQKTPWRVSLDAMKRKVVSVEYLHPESISHMTIAIVMLDNGYALLGKSAPADAANFNVELGQQYAYEDAMRQLWPLEAYVMRDHLSGKATVNTPEERWSA